MKNIILNLLVIASCALCGCDRTVDKPPSSGAPAVATRAASAPDQSRSPSVANISEARLLDDLRSQDFDRVVRTMNDVKGAGYAGHLTPIFIDFWNGTELHGVDPNFLNHPRIRIEIADVLAQQEKNGYQGLDKAGFAQYARGLISSNDTQVANQAMLVLGIAGSAADMSLLESLAENIAESRFRAAVIALLHNCNTTSALLEKLKASLTETWRKDFLAETREKFGSFQACTSR